MPHLRKDPITKRWIITSTSRSAKPTDFVSAEEPKANSELTCPFCVGHDEKIEPPILSTFDENGNWKTRIIANKYPVLSETSTDELPPNSILYESHSATGYHDVVIEYPTHNFNLYHATVDDFKSIFDIVVQRLKDLSNKKEMQYSLYFKNFGSDAGASLAHSHSQIITTPFIPINVMEDLHGTFDYYNTHVSCIYCAIVRQEQESGLRIVSENEKFIAFCPFASRSPYQISIMPKEHENSVLLLTEDDIYLFSSIVKDVFSKIYNVLGEPSFNYVLYTLPNHIRASYSASYHWHFDILPKLSKLAGFEIGSGVYINSVLPEHAAEVLRNQT